MILKTKKAINLSGKMSILGVSTLDQSVIEAMNIGAQNFYAMKNLYIDAEQIIASYFDAKVAFVTASASAAIVQLIWALKFILQKDTINIALPTGHHINYGAQIDELIEAAGAHVVPIGSANRLARVDLDQLDLHKIDAAFFVDSHHCVQKNHLSPTEFNDYFSNHQILTIIDAAAAENIWKINKYHFDFAIFSGSKAIAGPTSGFILFDQKKYKEHLVATRSTIGRAMKVGKESIFGLVTAINQYPKLRRISDQEARIAEWVKKFAIQGIDATINVDHDRQIKRIKLETTTKAMMLKISNHLHKNNIYTRDYHVHQGWIELDLRQTNDQELALTISKIKEVING